MDSIPAQFALSLRASPSNNDATGTLRSQIARIHVQRGNFRNISEDILEKEISAAEAGETTKEDEASSDEEEEEEVTDPVKELTTAKEQMVQQVAQALQSSQYALNFVSLLLSKYNPNTAMTISPDIREPGEYNIPIGTVGADKVQGIKQTDAQKLDNKRVTKGWKILSLKKSVDSILDAAKRLEQEMEAEAKYWEDVLAIEEKGWAISYATKTSQSERLNKIKSDGTLAVRFGFSESAPEFRNRGLAILRRTDDGSIALATDVLSTNPKRLQVRIVKDEIESGHSVFSLFGDLDDSIQSQVQKARNAIFEQELWHELLRESRNLVAYGVIVQDSSISLPISSTKSILLKFAADSDEISSPFSTNEDNKLANTICIAIHLLLSYSHRQRLRQRSQPPPPISAENNFGNPTTLPCYLLRPVIAHLYHQAAISSLHSLLSPITRILISAGLSSTYNVIQKPSPPPANLPNEFIYLPQSASEKVIRSLIDNIMGEATLTITQDFDGKKREIKFMIQFRTSMLPVATTQFRVLGASEAFKAPPAFASMAEVKEYMLFATTSAIAEFFTKSPEIVGANQGDGENGADNQQAESDAEETGWHTTIHTNVIRQAIPNTYEVRDVSFTFETTGTPTNRNEISNSKVLFPSNEEDAKLALRVHVNDNSEVIFPSNEEDAKLALRVDSKYKHKNELAEVPEDGGNRRTGGTSIWTVGGGMDRSLREVVECVKGGGGFEWGGTDSVLIY